MSKQTEALKLALGKIKSARDCHPNAVDTLLFEAEEILETALAEQPAQRCWKCGDMDVAFQMKCTVPACGMKEQPAQQEPVGRVCFEGDEVVWTDEPPESGTLLYTSPPAQRKPLTLGQKQRLWSSVGDKPTLKDRVNAYGLAIEAAHGIKGDA